MHSYFIFLVATLTLRELLLRHQTIRQPQLNIMKLSFALALQQNYQYVIAQKLLIFSISPMQVLSQNQNQCLS